VEEKKKYQLARRYAPAFFPAPHRPLIDVIGAGDGGIDINVETVFEEATEGGVDIEGELLE
jgi:hypothetical protein